MQTPVNTKAYVPAAIMIAAGTLTSLAALGSFADALPRTINEITYVASTGRGDFRLAAVLPTIIALAFLFGGIALVGGGLRNIRTTRELNRRRRGQVTSVSSASAGPPGARPQASWSDRARTELGKLEERLEQSTGQHTMPQGPRPGAARAPSQESYWNQAWPDRQPQGQAARQPQPQGWSDQRTQPQPHPQRQPQPQPQGWSDQRAQPQQLSAQPQQPSAQPQQAAQSRRPQPQAPGAERLERIQQLQQNVAERARQLSQAGMPTAQRFEGQGPGGGGQAAPMQDNVLPHRAARAGLADAATRTYAAARTKAQPRDGAAHALSALTSSSLASSSLSSSSLTRTSLRTNSLFRR